jgi:hypothetical protein
MFGDPCLRPTDFNAVILPFAWTHVHKIDPMTMEIVEKSELHATEANDMEKPSLSRRHTLPVLNNQRNAHAGRSWQH